MKSGIILEIKKDKVVVVNKEGHFDAIKYKNGMKVGQEIRYNENSLHKITKIAAVIVFGIVSVASITTYNIYNTPTTFISFGSSSNIQFTANQFGRVISTNVKNEKGGPMPSSEYFLNKDVTEASVAVMKMANKIGFIDDVNFDNQLNLVVVDENKQYIDDISKKIYDNLKKYFENNDITTLVKTNEYDEYIEEEAISKDIEPCKMFLIHVVLDFDEGLAKEEVESMSIKELNDRIKRLHIENLKNNKLNSIEEFKTQTNNIIDRNRMLQSVLEIAN